MPRDFEDAIVPQCFRCLRRETVRLERDKDGFTLGHCECGNIWVYQWALCLHCVQPIQRADIVMQGDRCGPWVHLDTKTRKCRNADTFAEPTYGI